MKQVTHLILFRRALLSATSALIVFMFPLHAFHQSGTRSDPQQAQIVTSDIDNFWHAYDLSAPGARDSTLIQREYLDKASPGLRDFIDTRKLTADRIAEAVHGHPKYFASLRATTDKLPEQRVIIYALFSRFKVMYPAAVFPDVYFLIGDMNSGGTATDAGLLMGAEMFGLTSTADLSELDSWHRSAMKSMDDIPSYVAHELMHSQQHYSKATRSVLERSIEEGSADFVAELLTGKPIHEPAYIYGRAHERELWQEFRKDLDSENFRRWLYAASARDQKPADLGYFIGYRITQSFYNSELDKRKALEEIFRIQDFHEFLANSHYESQPLKPLVHGNDPDQF